MKSTEDKICLNLSAEDQTALPASLINSQFDFYHGSTEGVIVNV